MIIYREQLDSMGCGVPNCHHDHSVLHLHGRCHPHAAQKVKYVKATGTLEICCAVCEDSIARVQVAAKPHAKPHVEIQ